jgi:thioesterase domain-containing protein
MVAFEMARLLEQQHEAVAFLGLLDTGLAYDPRRSPGTPLQDLLLALRLTMANMVKVKFPTSYRDLKQLASWFGVSLPASLQHLWQRELSSQWAFLRYLLGMSLRSFKLFRSNFIAGQQYVAAPYGGHATLFRTTPASVALPPTEDAVVTMLRTFVEGGLEVLYVPGNHMTLLETANVGILAQKIKAALAQA